MDGEKYDQESGLTHLMHAGCNIIFLIWKEIQKEKEEGFGDAETQTRQT
jgi:hypothetical protein